jgi:uncharacterized protein
MTAPDTSLLSHRVVEVPRLAGEPGGLTAAGRLRMLPVAAFACGGDRPLACCWLRARAGGRVVVLAGGMRAGTLDAGSSLVPVAFPAGARGVPLHAGQASRAVARLSCWQPAELAVDALGDGEHADGPGLEDLFALMPDVPMAVLVVGRPAPTDAVAARLAALSDAVDELAARAEGRGAERMRLSRAETELSYLERWAPRGLWELRVWTGAATAAECAAVAAQVGGSADLRGVPLRVLPTVSDVRSASSATVSDVRSASSAKAAGERAPSIPWGDTAIVGADSLVSLVRPPVRELPGIRVVDVPAFDLTPEVPADLVFGSVLDATRTPCSPFGVPASSVNRHVFVTGATGSGKSQTVRTILEQLTAAGVPWLVVEPAKAEYRAMASRLGSDVVRIRPGDPDAVPAGINPLEPVAGFSLPTHLDLVRALFVAAFEADEPFPQVLSAALTRCYEDLGWDLALGEPVNPGTTPRYPTLVDLQRTAEKVVSEIGYGREVTDNVRGFIRVRLASLRLGATGRFFQGGHPVDFAVLRKQRVVLEIEDVGDDRDKAFLMGTVVLGLTEHLRVAARDTAAGGLRHVTVIEEAHRLLRRGLGAGGAAEHAVEMFAAMLAEVRAYGEGIVIAEQIPAKLIPDTVKNTAVKIVHRLPASDDRDAVGATMNLADDQSSFLVTLPPGEAAVFTDGMDSPVLVRVTDGTHRETAGHRTASPAAVVTTRSAACGMLCRSDPCTLRQMRAAQRLPETVHALTLWAELAVLGHLTGWPLPVLAAEPITTLRALDTRLRDCAVGHAVDDAVAVRSTVISRDVSPGALAGHVAAAMRDMLDGRWTCERDEPSWRVGDPALRAARRTLTLGDASPTTLETAVGCATTADGWQRALGAAMANFRDCRWPLAELTIERMGMQQDGDRRHR